MISHVKRFANSLGPALSLLLLYTTMASTFRIAFWGFLGADYGGVPVVELLILPLSLGLCLLLRRSITRQLKKIFVSLKVAKVRLNRASVFAFPFFVSVSLGSLVALTVGGIRISALRNGYV